MRHVLVAVAVLWIGELLAGCADDGYRGRPVRYGAGYPGSPRPYYRKLGPWDLPSTSSYPGPPTWYGCPQGAAACYPD